MKNKGFTLIELLAVIVILGIVMGIATVSYNYQIQKSRKDYYDIAIKNMKGAAESMIVFCNTNPDKSFCTNTNNNFNIGSLIYKKDASYDIELSTLVDNGFMDNITNQKDGTDCTQGLNSGSVKVTNNTGNANGLEYEVTLHCGND